MQVIVPGLRNGFGKAFNELFRSHFQVVHATTPELRQSAYKLRYQIFCIENDNFENPAAHTGLAERDRYDDHAHQILLLHKDSGYFVGGIRVVMPDLRQPEQSFPLQAVVDHPLLHSRKTISQLCEISRLGVSSTFMGMAMSTYELRSSIKESLAVGGNLPNYRGLVGKQLARFAKIALFQGAFETALDNGHMHCLGVMEPKLISRLEQYGFHTSQLGPTIEFHGLRQPILFNILSVYRRAHMVAPLIYQLASNGGRLCNQAEMLENGHRPALPTLVDLTPAFSF